MTTSTTAGGSVRELRRAAGLTQQELARRASCSVSYVQLLDAGYRPNDGPKLRAVLAILGNDEPAQGGGADGPAPDRIAA